jgi:hypothetical protein
VAAALPPFEEVDMLMLRALIVMITVAWLSACAVPRPVAVDPCEKNVCSPVISPRVFLPGYVV